MFDARFALPLIAALGLASPALAQDTGKRIDDLDATRINAFQILIDFEYQGGACENVGPAEIGDLVDGTLAVNFPTTSTAEVCTMQVKEQDVKQAIPAENIISRVDVTLTGPDGAVIGTGSTDVDHD